MNTPSVQNRVLGEGESAVSAQSPLAGGQSIAVIGLPLSEIPSAPDALEQSLFDMHDRIMEDLLSGTPNTQDLLDYTGTDSNEETPVVDYDEYWARKRPVAKSSVARCADIQTKQQQAEERLRAAVAALPPYMPPSKAPGIVLKTLSESGPPPKSTHRKN